MVIRKSVSHIEDETKVNQIIKKGGSTTAELNVSNQPYKLTLRIPYPLKVQVEKHISADPTQPSLTAWILEAMKQKLNR